MNDLPLADREEALGIDVNLDFVRVHGPPDLFSTTLEGLDMIDAGVWNKLRHLHGPLATHQPSSQDRFRGSGQFVIANPPGTLARFRLVDRVPSAHLLRELGDLISPELLRKRLGWCLCDEFGVVPQAAEGGFYYALQSDDDNYLRMLCTFDTVCFDIKGSDRYRGLAMVLVNMLLSRWDDYNMQSFAKRYMPAIRACEVNCAPKEREGWPFGLLEVNNPKEEVEQR